MKKLYFVLILSMLSFISNGQTDLATWNLTSNGNATSIAGVTADALIPNQINTNYSSAGLRTHGWTNAYNSDEYFQITVQPNGVSSVSVTGLNFNQTRNGNGPTNFKIKYYISNSGSTISNANFLSDANNGDVTLVNDALIASNGTVQLSFPTAITLSTTQKLLVRFYASGGTSNTTDENNNWTIAPNSLKIRNCISQETPNAFGINNWIGSVYTWNSTNSTTGVFLGTVTEPETFNRDMGTGVVTGTTTALCATPAENFFVRYKMRKNFSPGQYSITVGADDGYRFSIDGGVTWIAELSSYVAQSYASKTHTLCLSDNTDLVIEYFENGGDSRVSFNYTNIVAPPTSISSTPSNCPGAAVTLTAVGGTGNTYQWGTGTAVGSNIIAGATGVSVVVNPSTSTTNYWVRRVYTSPCSGATDAATLTYNLSPVPGDQISYGNNNWIGYVYDWNFTNLTPTTYLGYVTENEIFDRNLVTGAVTGLTSVLCATPAENFFVRYKMRKNFAAGQYSITIGGDDGYRFSIDGGATWISELSSFIAQSYGTPKTHTLCLNGNTDLVLEYFENTGNSRISVNYNQITVATPTSLTASTSICNGSSTTLTAVGTGTFQWGTGTVGSNIMSQTGNSITVSPSSTTTYWVRSVITTPCIIYSTALTSTVTVTIPATAPTSISSTSSSCSGAAVTLTAVGGSGNTYQWGTGSVGSNIIAGATGVSVVVNPTASTTNYWVRRVNTTPCSGTTGAATLAYNLLPVPGDQTSFGNESWIGYVYDWNATNLTPTTYLGYVTEPEIFNRNIGSGAVTGTTALLCSTPNDNFFIRYKMRKNFAPGQYSITVGADDGYRFSIDGGATWIAGLSNYVPHSYSTTTLSICLNGSTDLVLEYFENAVDARVSFTYSLNPVTAPTSLTASGSICNGGSRTLTAGGSGPFEWGTGTVGENILGQTGSSITVSPNVTTTYWVRRRVTTPCLGYSNALTSTVTVVSPATAPTSITGGDFIYCDNSTITLTASGGSGNTYQWGTGSTIGSSIIAGTGASITVTLSATTTYWVRRTNVTPCTGNTDGVSKMITRAAPPGDPTVFGDNQWHVYGFNSDLIANPTNYQGYYVQNLGADLGFDSKLKWLETATPSSAPDWQGCTVNATNYTFIHKRRGFPCGRYQLAFLYYDDDTVVTVTDANGTVWTQTYTGYYNGGAGLSQPINGTNTFALDAKSTVEVRTMNGNGDSKAGVIFTNNGTAIYANGSWDKAASYSDIQVNDNLNLAADLTVCSCIVQSGRVVTVHEDKSLVVLENISVANGGKIIVENNGSLVQVNDNATYTGANDTFEMNRNTQPVYRLDYTYWSSPIKTASGFTLNNLSPNTLASKYYKWEDAWVAVNSNTEVMVPGRGYIVRSPQGFDMQGQVEAQPQVFPSNFKGQPNNGVLNIAVNGDSKWNLIGNPYPSALDINEFYRNTTNRSLLDGTVYFWTHNTQIALDGGTGFYNYSPSDYAAFNMSGGTGTAASSEPNALANVPTGYVAAGQSFFVQGVASGNVVFNNSMRIKQGGFNYQFFRPTPTETVENWQNTGKHRVWLNLTSTQNDFNQVLVGYIENATNGLDWGYDGEVFSGSVVTLYSILENKNYTIQGRSLPFSNQDEVPLGYKTTLTGTLKIAIDRFDGLFEGQNIYLKDNLLNIVHDLKESDYTFTTVPGTFNERFVLRYLPQADLSINPVIKDAHSVLIFNSNNQISIQSAELNIQQVEIYDLQGRVLFSKNKINNNQFSTQNLNVNNQVILVKITTENNQEIIKKVMMN